MGFLCDVNIFSGVCKNFTSKPKINPITYGSLRYIVWKMEFYYWRSYPRYFIKTAYGVLCGKKSMPRNSFKSRIYKIRLEEIMPKCP